MNPIHQDIRFLAPLLIALIFSACSDDGINNSISGDRIHIIQNPDLNLLAFEYRFQSNTGPWEKADDTVTNYFSSASADMGGIKYWTDLVIEYNGNRMTSPQMQTQFKAPLKEHRWRFEAKSKFGVPDFDASFPLVPYVFIASPAPHDSLDFPAISWNAGSDRDTVLVFLSTEAQEGDTTDTPLAVYRIPDAGSFVIPFALWEQVPEGRGVHVSLKRLKNHGRQLGGKLYLFEISSSDQVVFFKKTQ